MLTHPHPAHKSVGSSATQFPQRRDRADQRAIAKFTTPARHPGDAPPELRSSTTCTAASAISWRKALSWRKASASACASVGRRGNGGRARGAEKSRASPRLAPGTTPSGARTLRVGARHTAAAGFRDPGYARTVARICVGCPWRPGAPLRRRPLSGARIREGLAFGTRPPRRPRRHAPWTIACRQRQLRRRRAGRRRAARDGVLILQAATEYARRRTRASVEELRSPGATACDVRSGFLLFGESRDRRVRRGGALRRTHRAGRLRLASGARRRAGLAQPRAGAAARDAVECLHRTCPA